MAKKDGDKPKRKQSEAQLKNLIPFNKRPLAERIELAKRGAAKTNQIKAQKIAREESRDIIFEELCGNREKLRQLIAELSPKDKKDLLNNLLPPDPQKQEITGDLTSKTIYVSETDEKEVLKHILDVVNE